MPFFDGDDFHPSEQRKMRSGIPLTDEDREGWLIRLNGRQKRTKKNGAIIACSALKENRMILSGGISVPVYWVFLQGSFD